MILKNKTEGDWNRLTTQGLKSKSCLVRIQLRLLFIINNDSGILKSE